MPRTRSQEAIAKCKIFLLNDDCLLEIFSHLPTIDLCAVKDTCRRFSGLADSTMENRFCKERTFKWNPDFDNRKNLTLILRHFAHLIVSKMVIQIQSDFDAKKIWSLPQTALKNCPAYMSIVWRSIIR